MDPVFFEVLTNPTIIALNSGVAFCMGLFLGNRLALDRDKRKEFNDTVRPIRASLLKEKERPSLVHYALDIVDIDSLYYLLPIWKRPGFRKAVQRYERTKKECQARDSKGGTFFKDEAPIKHSAARLLNYTRLR